MKRIIFLLLISALLSTCAWAQRPSATVYKTPATPVIDGNIDDEWTPAIQYNIDKKFKAEEPTFGPSGTTYWKALWDDNGMYILIVANDDNWFPFWAPGAGFNSWEYDKPELYFDTNSKLEDGLGGQQGNTGHTQIAPDSQEGNVNGGLQSAEIRGAMINYAYKVTDPAWNVEYFIPWDCIRDKNGARFDRSGTMGFDVTLVDRDQGDSGRKRAQWANAGAKDENWNNMDDAGHLTFQDLLYIEGGSPKTFVYGEKAQLSAKNNFIDPGTLTYSWSPAEGLSQTDIPNPVVTATTDRTYTLTVTASNGSIGKATVFIKVNPFVATAADQTVPCGNTAQLDVSTNYTGPGTLTYTWHPQDVLDNPAIRNPKAKITQPTDFTVEVTTPEGTATQKTVHVALSKLNYQQELCLVSVDANHKNVLVWNNPGQTAVHDYLIFRESLIQTDFYDLIGSVPASEETVYTDLSSNALVQSNKYKIAARDNCGFVSNQSIPHKTMHLSINRGQGTSWNLIWEPYDGFAVSSYKIYRGTSPDNLSMIGSTAGSANSYSDFTAPEGDVYYLIEVTAPVSCNSLKLAALTSARSNIATNSDVGVHSLKNELCIFPIPVKERLFLNKDLNCLSAVVILSVDGRVELSLAPPIAGESIDVSRLQKGIYLLKLADDKGIFTQKFIKE